MAFQRVPAGRGLQWLTDAVQLVLQNPVPFALMGLVVGVIALVPLLGSLALLILGPALYGGVMYAAREQQAGRAADFQQLFQAFKEDGKLPKMLVLCLPGVVAGVVIVALAVMFIGGALLGGGLSASAGASSSALGTSLGVGTAVFVLVALAVGLASYALTFFATPRVMLEAAEPFDAMKDSLQACLANIGAVLVFVAILLGTVVLLSVLLSLIPILGQLLLMVALVPVASAASFFAWRDVYRQPITQELPPATPPPAPNPQP
jgi:hypothetical protein